MAQKEMTLQEIQQTELHMVLELEKVCRSHNLRFYIDGGTLLGSYSFKGFIPWDDDIDIKMPRKDYEQLSNYREELPEYMNIVLPEEDGYTYTFTKINDVRTELIENPGTPLEHRGSVYLDILPMDGHPTDSKTLRKLERYKTLFHESKTGFINLKHSKKFITKIKGYVYALIYTNKSIYLRMTKLAASCPYDSAENVGLVIEGDKKKETFKRESLDHPVMMPFEGYMFPASSDYEQHLVNFYGEHILKAKDNGNLPHYPSSHKHEVYWKEN